MNLFTLSLIFFLQGGVIKEDFCVHPDSPARSGKEGAWVAALPQGWAVTWSDYRNPGVWGVIDVYAQLLDTDAEPVDSNFRVNVSSGDILEAAGTVGADGQGNILVTWGASQVRFRRRFTPDGEPQGEIVEGGMSGVHLGMNQSGDYVTVGVEGYLQINLQAFAKDDICKWGPVEVAVAERFGPTARAAIAPDGSSVVVWDDVIDGVSCIFGRCFDKDGLP
ncbi:hypothetical protein GF359_03205, partial [candidate division WOR-3 bacterium]|nr:hypothetical protein [candidate division WOR-3 bacterium]MBD3364203.1 hypothetical protein [candidate division WOR-3 bacterium]